MTETSAQIRQLAESYFGIRLPQDSLDELESLRSHFGVGARGRLRGPGLARCFPPCALDLLLSFEDHLASGLYHGSQLRPLRKGAGSGMMMNKVSSFAPRSRRAAGLLGPAPCLPRPRLASLLLLPLLAKKSAPSGKQPALGRFFGEEREEVAPPLARDHGHEDGHGLIELGAKCRPWGYEGRACRAPTQRAGNLASSLWSGGAGLARSSDAARGHGTPLAPDPLCPCALWRARRGAPCGCSRASNARRTRGAGRGLGPWRRWARGATQARRAPVRCARVRARSVAHRIVAVAVAMAMATWASEEW